MEHAFPSLGISISLTWIAEGSVAVASGCFGPTTSGPITAANGTVPAQGEDLHLEVALEPQWALACCPHSGRISPADLLHS